MILDALPKFVKDMRRLFDEQRQAVVLGDGLNLDTRLAMQKRLSKVYSIQRRKLADDVRDAATAWGDSTLSGRLEYQLDRLDDLAEQFEAVVDPNQSDPRIADQIAAIASTISGIVVRHDYWSDPREEREKRRLRAIGGETLLARVTRWLGKRQN